jgi:pantetheine-phosphate adenylyltransferase
MNYKTAIYPGTFDPITKGHLDVILRASKLFDKVTIGISENAPKSPLFSAEIRVKMVNETLVSLNLANVNVKIFQGLLVDFAKEEEAGVVVRGLRAVSDFEYEFQMACVNSKLAKNLETIFLPSSDEVHFISSRIVKSIANLNGDVSSFVPKEILKYFK